MSNSLLNAIQSLITLSPAETEIVSSLFKERSYKKGEFFLEEGRICKHAGFITKGLLRYYINDDGEEKTYAFSQENGFVCNYESFLPQSPSSKIIQALEDCEIRSFPTQTCNFFMQKSVKGNVSGGWSSKLFFCSS